jgi:hypothetical protein
VFRRVSGGLKRRKDSTEGPNAFLQLRSGHDERRGEAQDVLARRDEEQPCVLDSRQQVARHEPRAQHEAAQQTLAARAGADAREIPCELLEHRAEGLTLGRSALDEALLVQDAEDSQGRGGRERVAAERGSVRTGWQRAREPLGGEHRADRKASAEPLREGDGVGPSAAVAAEETPEAADPRLNFIDEQQRAVGVRDLP